MDKLYWIVCEENDKTLFEGRFLGRTRNSALKHLKEQLGRSNMIGIVFSITEIPVPLIREIVQEILDDLKPDKQITVSEKPTKQPLLFPENQPMTDDAPPSGAKVRRRNDYDWEAIKECYIAGRSPKDVVAKLDVPMNTLRKRITREGWAKQRRAQ